jgi:hypothetical protein
MALDTRLQELNEELRQAESELSSLLVNTPQDDVNLEANILSYTDTINTITKEMASIVEAIN